MARESILLAVGDVAPGRADPTSLFTGVRAALQAGDLVFGQLEAPVTARGARAPHAKLAMRCPPSTAPTLRATGFDVMSCAGNHCLDWGTEGLEDTLALVKAGGVQLCGAGLNLEQARLPAFGKCGDAVVAFLAYSSILPDGYWAEARRGGCAPLRAHTTYEMIEPDQPGTQPRILTHAHAGDLEALLRDVRLARAFADLVVLSVHWGIHMTPVVIADYQRQIAHAAIDAGVDVILGHHPHILKGVEFYRDKPVFYSLGNFAIDPPQVFDPGIIESASFRHLLSLHPGARPDGVYVLPEDTRHSVIVNLRVSGKRITEVAVQPVWIDDGSVPHALTPADARFAAVAAYLQDVSARAGFALRVATDAGRVVLTAG